MRQPAIMKVSLHSCIGSDMDITIAECRDVLLARVPTQRPTGLARAGLTKSNMKIT